MTAPEVDALLSKGLKGTLSPEEQHALAEEFHILREMARRMETVIHETTKDLERAIGL
jgi:hypothetical protein